MRVVDTDGELARFPAVHTCLYRSKAVVRKYGLRVRFVPIVLKNSLYAQASSLFEKENKHVFVLLTLLLTIQVVEND